MNLAFLDGTSSTPGGANTDGAATSYTACMVLVVHDGWRYMFALTTLGGLGLDVEIVRLDHGTPFSHVLYVCRRNGNS